MPKRYTYKGDYRDFKRLPFRSKGYVSDHEIRSVLSDIVANDEMLHETVVLVEEEYVQFRWKRSSYGKIAELFPDVLERQAVMNDPTLTDSMRVELDKAQKKGLSKAIARTRELLSFLERLAAIETRQKERSPHR